MKIFEERISNGANEVEYRIKVKQFRERMNKWKTGRTITNLSPFYFMDSEFKLKICPNGETDESKGFVSLYLMNENEEDLYVSYSLSLGLKMQSLENQKIISNLGFGRAKFYCHSGYPIEENDDNLEIICTITKLMKDPAAGKQLQNHYQLTSEIRSDVRLLADDMRDFADSHSKEKGRLLASETDMKNTFSNLMQGQKTMQMEFKKKIDEMTKSIQELKNLQINHQMQQQQQLERFDDMENDNQFNFIPKPKCVKCGSNLTSTLQIDQCPAGHLMCHICKNISGQAKCPLCHEPTARATGLESYLKILFPTTVENYEFLSKYKSPQNISNVK